MRLQKRLFRITDEIVRIGEEERHTVAVKGPENPRPLHHAEHRNRQTRREGSVPSDLLLEMSVGGPGDPARHLLDLRGQLVSLGPAKEDGDLGFHLCCEGRQTFRGTRVGVLST